jgi:hypothetical protein
MNDSTIINKNFTASLFPKNIGKIFEDFGEVAIDSMMTEGVLKDIPIIGTILNLAKTGIALKERHMIRKLLLFLKNLEDISTEDKNKFTEKLNEDGEFAENISEKLLLIIDRLDETEKAKIVANIFKLYVYGLIEQQMFLRLTLIVERGFLSDLQILHITVDNEFHQRYDKQDHKNFHNSCTQHSLFSLGLLEAVVKQEQDIPVKVTSTMPGKHTKTNDLNLKTTYGLSTLGRALGHAMYYDANELAKFNHLRNLYK